MTVGRFHHANETRRRGGCLPARLRRTAARRGVTLVELMVSMLILTIVCLAWLEIIGVQSARREARRREAVERLAGMMDAFLYRCKDPSVFKFDSGHSYRMEMNEAAHTLTFKDVGTTNVVQALFDGAVSSIGYQLCVVEKQDLPGERLFGDNWGKGRWLVGRLYERNGAVADAGKPFFTLPVCMEGRER